MQEMESLVRAAQGGDQVAFGQIYERFFDRVFRYVAARVGLGADAEDLTQEVFLKAVGSIHRFELRGRPFAAWLFRIAHNVVVDRYRRATAAAPTLPLESIVHAQDGTDVEASALLALDLEQLRRALGQVTELQRQVVLLRFIGGLSLAETGSVMRRNENAIKALQYSALRALRRVLTPTSAGTEIGR